MEIKPCPFCGGKAKLSYKYSYGPTTRTEKIQGAPENTLGEWLNSFQTIYTYYYRVQVICNKCHGRGKPVFTKVESYSKWNMDPKARAAYEPFEQKAIEAWNKRAKYGNEFPVEP